MKKLMIAMASVLAASHAYAAENIKYVCQFDNAERIIEVRYTNSPDALPCEVNYSKNGQDEVLWRASNTPGYCESKAADLVEKQKAWGWDCTKLSETASVNLSEGATEAVEAAVDAELADQQQASQGNLDAQVEEAKAAVDAEAQVLNELSEQGKAELDAQSQAVEVQAEEVQVDGQAVEAQVEEVVESTADSAAQ
ncbi:hypothetical protein VST7929_02749 [Vibrio stylophorae]|uniref:DUF1496 domain-containing protein n=1 Tax=Vibrio stylophorae TaxID=659351 RepID=A0ABN8DXI4_9VIBR|nr:hypothetical protein [Vibrio stylophorae]CAH0535088.1 hypothetical protein VST7929_02749 [Vibrio stylophorae]